MAYKLPSKLPTYTTPLLMAGEERTRPSVTNFQRGLPDFASNAYTNPSPPPTTTVSFRTAAEDRRKSPLKVGVCSWGSRSYAVGTTGPNCAFHNNFPSAKLTAEEEPLYAEEKTRPSATAAEDA